MIKKFSVVLLLVALVAFIPACGGKKIKTEGVTGKVTLDGQPLANATVFFTPAACKRAIASSASSFKPSNLS